MSEPLEFLMGKFAASLPADLLYCRNHTWCRPAGGVLRFGFSSYAIRLMQDVYFLDWSIAADTTVAAKQQIGNIETSKAVSDLFAPIAGTITQFNAETLKDPSAINVDGYGRGWLFEMQGSSADLIDAAAYHAFLTANWDQTQRILKGQMGE